MNTSERFSIFPLATVAIIALLTTWVIDSCIRVTRLNPHDWLIKYGAMATTYAKSAIAGESNAPPGALTQFRIEHMTGVVSFTCRGGALNSSGMAYSEKTTAPPNGLGGEPKVIRWERIENNWYYWVSD